MFKKIAIALVLVFTLTLFACDSGSKVEYPKKYGIVDVVAGEETKTGVKLTLETDGFGGTIKAEVTVVDGKIVDYDVIENSESAGWGKALIEDGAILQAIIDETENLDTFDVHDYLDAEAGATVTGEALLEIALAALEHYTDDYE